MQTMVGTKKKSDGYAITNDDKKTTQNVIIGEYAKKIPLHKKAVIIDTKEGNSFLSLVNRFSSSDIHIVNYNSKELDNLKENMEKLGHKIPNENLHEKSFSEAIRSLPKSSLIYYDSCGTLKYAYSDLYNLFKEDKIANECYFFCSLSSRGCGQRFDPSRDLPEPYRMKNFWNYDETDTWSAYYADMLIKDYADRFNFAVERLYDSRMPKAQYRKNMYFLFYRFMKKLI